MFQISRESRTHWGLDAPSRAVHLGAIATLIAIAFAWLCFKALPSDGVPATQWDTVSDVFGFSGIAALGVSYYFLGNRYLASARLWTLLSAGIAIAGHVLLGHAGYAVTPLCLALFGLHFTPTLSVATLTRASRQG